MTPKLTEELHQALAQHPGEPLQVEDPVTHAHYVLVPLDVYEQWRRVMDYDTGEPDPRDFYPAFAEAVKDELDAPGMERYDREATARKQP
jgi:hypothetical protein